MRQTVAKVDDAQLTFTLQDGITCLLLEPCRPTGPREFTSFVTPRNFQKLLCRWTC